MKPLSPKDLPPLTKAERASLEAYMFALAPEKPDAKDRALAKEVLRRAVAPVQFDDRAARYGGGGFVFGIEPNRVVVHPKLRHHARLLGHELGHADFHQSLVGPVVQSRAAKVMYGLQIPVAMLAAILPKKPSHKVLATALSVAALSAPTLISEHQANSRGRRLLTEAGATEKQLDSFDRHCVAPLSTYYVAPALALATAAVYGVGSHVARGLLTKRAGDQMVSERDFRRQP